MTIIEALRQNVALHPDKTYCRFMSADGQIDMTYAALWRRSSGVAAGLCAAGVQAGDVVIIMIRHRVELYSAFIGAMMLGAIPSFMPFPNVKQRADVFWPSHQTLFARVKPAAFVTEGDFAEPVATVAPEGAVILIIDDLPRSGNDPAVALDPDGIAFLQHSSGTTGTKKGVMLSHRAVLDQVRCYAPAIGFDRDSRIASWLPLYHDMGLIACLFTPLIVGASVTHVDPLEWTNDPLLLLDLIERDRATHAWMPNFAFNHLVLNRRRAKGRMWSLDSLRMIINCSEPCKAESMEAFVEAYADCGVTAATPQVCYAMAENVFAVSQTSPEFPVRTLLASVDAMQYNRYEPAEGPEARRLPSCGRVISEVEVVIAGPDGPFDVDGMIGEIWIRGSSLFNGYHRLPHVTAQKLQNGWYRSGDLGFLQDGELFVTGRMDDLIIVRGRNFYAHDIEAMVSAVPGVKPGRTVTFGVANPMTGTNDVICLAEADGTEPDLASVRREAKIAVETQSGLVLAKVQLLPLGSLVKTTSGKISREMNKKLFVENRLVQEAGDA